MGQSTPTLKSPESGNRSLDDGREDAEFLGFLGKRVRETRDRRGMARKVLARDADVSERYLAQLEGGEGNISIVLLRRIAVALGVSVEELLRREDEPPFERRLIQDLLEQLPPHRREQVVSQLMRDLGSQESMRKKRVALIGLRGAGKSTLGELLAAELHMPFVEIDREIEKEAGIPLSEVFMLYGQSGYRRMERRCLGRVIGAYQHAILSVSGGVVSEIETYNLLLSHCFTVWLKAAPEEHMARVAAQGDLRPMRDNEEAMEDLRRILAAREPLYAKADAVVDTAGKTPEESLLTLRRAIMA